ncbi:MAG: hypothetical protein MN733_38380, partial [Nitrososphaera sp.]|nr:hypothetical protein [Nitrososphaera sp.]
SAILMIKKAKELAKGKGVYPFLNPRYSYTAYGGIEFKPIPKDYFRLQLDTMKANGADGVVIWGMDLYTRDWSDTQPGGYHAGWWAATKEFLSSQ